MTEQAASRRMLANITGQGTAMAETALCSECDPSHRARVLDENLNVHDWNRGPRLDCTGNEELECTACGWRAEVCDECGAQIPDSEPSMVNGSHEPSCSLHPSASEPVAAGPRFADMRRPGTQWAGHWQSL